MRMISRSLALAVTSLGLFGLVGCGEDNEKAAGGEGPPGVKGAGTVDPKTYGKAGAGDMAPKTEEGSSTPAAPAATP